MTTIDKSGISVEEIIRNFRREHNISDHELHYEIIKKPSKGFFGLFANKLALVRFQLPGQEDRIRLFTETLLHKMGVSFGSISTKIEAKTLFLTIEKVSETGFVIGKNGSMLETIQYFVNRVFENDNTFERIYLDADGYRERRESQFIGKFIPQINKIKTQGKSLTLDPMSPGERRIIHRHIEKDKGLRTLTIGEGENKRIVIFSAKQKESEVLKQSREQKSPETSEEAPKPQRNRRPRKPQARKPAAQAPDAKESSPENSDAKSETKSPRPRGPRKPYNRNRKPRPKPSPEEK
jgi:spoIIIJ-associated protein